MPKLCKTPSCQKQAAPRSNYCYACAKRTYRKNHPFEAAYRELKYGAKRRGKSFELTFEEFKKFAIETPYWQNKGRHSTSLHIDRIDENGPYAVWNIQPLQNSENIHKFRRFIKRTIEGPQFDVITSRPVSKLDTPF